MSLASTDHPRPALIRFFRSPSRPYILLLLMVFAAAAALRLYGLDTFPQGFHHDEAIDALAAQGILRGEHPIFFTNVNPREPLMIYLQSVGVLVFGATKVGARVMQGLTGTASVVVAWFLLRDLFGRRVALLGAAFMAISLWHVVDSRIGMRSISQPLLETACLLFFWRLAHSARWRDAVLAGVFLGGTLYTYSGARALPILLVVLVGWQALTAPGFVRRMWAQVLAVAGIGLVVFAPLGIYFIQNPDKFYGRSLEVNVINPQPFTGSAGAGSVWQETLRTLAMFSFRGDAAWKYNIGGQPVFDWPVSLLFYGGILIALLAVVTYLRTSRKRRPLACAAAFSLLGGLIMLLPSAISSEAPTYLRTIGSMPMVFAFPALTLSWLMDRWRWCAPLAGLLLVAEGAKTGYDYFAVLGHSTDAYYAMHGPAADVALLLNRQPTNAPVLFSSEYPGHPTVQYLAPAAFPGIRWFNGRESVAFPPPGSRALYVFSDGYTPGFTSLGSLFPADALVAQGHDPGGATAYEIFNASGPPAAFRPASPVSAQIANVANLDGFTVDASTVRAGGSVRVQEYWHVTQPATRDLRMFVHAV
ncbi:MAG: glycosyltransferase family 39 protein, partial [Chloroflexi bacterium]|nr:glycosyltransferase family 39 protein [Chloroflexota bacterium]